MPELHLNQPGFTFSACGPCTKHHERILKFRGAGNLKHLYRNELDKGCFAHDATYSDSKDLAKRTISDKILKIKHDEHQRELASMVCKFFDRKTGSGISLNEQLAEELHKPVIKKFKRTKVYA